MMIRRYLTVCCGVALLAAVTACSTAQGAAAGRDDARSALAKIGTGKGVCAVVGLPADRAEFLLDLARQSELLIYFQSPDEEHLATVRASALAAGLLGDRIFVDKGDPGRVHLADNLADAVLVSSAVNSKVSEKELLRVLRPGGKAITPGGEIVKPFPRGTDSWSHPYHGPDNNTQSTDQTARAPYLTQFLADPKFCPMPEVTVAAGGRVFRAFGHIAHKENQNAMLNTLLCVNAYNGTTLWRRDLKPGFMIHRNTMIATPDTLMMADNESCKLLDAQTGELKDEIVISADTSDGKVWKWMALEDGVLYALIGTDEIDVAPQPSAKQGLGHWPWGMWQGHDYADPKTSFGFGRTVLAIDPGTKKILWSHTSDDFIDSRGVCMAGNRIYVYSPERFLACLDATSGDTVWKNSAADLIEAIGPNQPAQHYVTGYATSTYIKCNDRYVLFAGPQRPRLVVASADDGKLLWQKEGGNYQLVLRDDGFFAAGPLRQPNRPVPTEAAGFKLAYATGEILAELPVPGRRACTRATGSVDSIFFRAPGGTVRLDLSTGDAYHIAPMRPPCQDGVIISDGLLHWGPWMCGCQLSLYGHICLAPAGDHSFLAPGDDSQLEIAPGDIAAVEQLPDRPNDWPAYRGDNARSSTTVASIPRRVGRQWQFRLPDGSFPTAPVIARGLVFLGDRSGVVRALDATTGKLRWQASTGGAVYFPPAIHDGRAYVGSADGRVYAFAAATGRPLWTFRAAPAERWISVHGRLMSTWPVAGGVVADGETVYAAAGIAHYDGTHVYALDAITGKVKWYNGSSGTISQKAHGGVSLQGNLSIQGGELRFLGGGVHETARYDLATGKCLNEPFDDVQSRFHTSFYAYYPDYGKYLCLNRTLADGRRLCYDVTYEGSVHGPLMLLPPLGPGAVERPKTESRWGMGRQGFSTAKSIWQQPADRHYSSFVTGDHVLLAAGHAATDGQGAFVSAIDIDDGSVIWSEKLSSPVVKGGTAVSQSGPVHIVVSLEDGRIICLGTDN